MDPDPRFQPKPEEVHASRPGEAHLPESEYRRPDAQTQSRESSSGTGLERRLGTAYTPPPNFNGGESKADTDEKKKSKGFSGAMVAVIALVACVGIYALIPHATNNPGPSQAQPQSVAPSQNPNADGRITVSVDGVVYGTFSATQSTFILERFLKAGDQVVVTCVLLPEGSPSIVARVGTNIRVYESGPLTAGQSQTWSVRAIHRGEDPGKAASPAALQWFQQQADEGSAVAQYGLGNMYDVGIDGLPVDHAKAIALFQSAASQSFGNAADRAAELQQDGHRSGNSGANTP